MKIISIAIALFVSLVTNAQVNPKEGFIITNEKDTIYGMIEYRTNHINAQQCVFKANDASEYVKYVPGKILGYRFKESGKFYVSKKFDNDEAFFAEVLIDGIMNLYRREKGFRKIYYLENEEGKVVQYENLDGDMNYEQRTANMRAQKLVQHVYKSQRAIDDIKAGEMSDKQMIKMVRDYHEDVCTSNEDGFRGNMFSVGASLDIDLSRYANGMLFQIMGSYFGIKSKNENALNFLELNTGVMGRFPINNKLKFTVRGGLAFSTTFEHGALGYGLCKGLYGGCGLELPVQKHAVFLNVDGKSFGTGDFWGLGDINILQGTIGFRF